MDGDEVRRLVFPQTGGYDTAAVDELLGWIAAELDAGRPVTRLIEGATFQRQPVQPWKGFRGGYDCASVDGMLAQLRRQDDPEARADPWRDLPAWRYSMASPDSSAAELASPAGRATAVPRVGRVQAAKDYAQECAEACRDFGAQPGTRLGLVKTSVGRRELLTADQDTLASARTVPARSLVRDGRIYRLSRVTAAQWPAVAAEIGDERPGSPAHLPRTEAARRDSGTARKDFSLKSLADRAGPPVLYTGGTHIDRTAHGYVQFPGRRWLRFPVRGTRRSNAIMTAVDQEGRQVARYMIGDRRAIDITVHPDQRLTDELILTLALTARWVSSYFDSSGGGG